MMTSFWDMLFCPLHGILRPETWPLIHAAFTFAWTRRQ